jgi:hypothetical protein
MRGLSFGQPKSIAIGCGTIGGKGGGITTILGDLGGESMLLSLMGCWIKQCLQTDGN